MLNLIARRKSEQAITAATDVVLFGMSLPSDSVINRISMRGEILPDVVDQEINAVTTAPYAFEVWVLPVDDPDAADDFNAHWDRLVPKDSDVQTLDLDTGAADGTVFYEPGEFDWQSIFDVGRRPHRLHHFHKELTINNTRGMRFVDSQTPFEAKWMIGDTWSYRNKRRLYIEQPSILLVGFGVPANDDTVTTQEAPLAENEWPRVKFLGDTIKMAMMDVFGITESTAETPWEEATDLLQRHLDPDPRESSGFTWGSFDLRVTGEMTVDHDVVGELAVSRIADSR